MCVWGVGGLEKDNKREDMESGGKILEEKEKGERKEREMEERRVKLMDPELA